VSVVGSPADSVILPRHYGSAYVMSDYKTNAHNIYFAAGFLPTPKLQLTGTVVYNITDAKYQEVLLPEIEIQSRLVNTAHPSGDLEHQDFNFEDMISYSDLDYKLLRLGLSLSYKISPRVTLTTDGEFADLTDDSGGYVYGIETGQYFMVRAGVGLEF
jgi:hypothetical protein